MALGEKSERSSWAAGSFQLREPPFPRLLGVVEFFAPGVPVPEATMHEHHGLVFWKDDVGAAGKFLHVQPETKTHFMQYLANNCLGRGVFAPNAGHVPTAAFFG